jgi:thiamine biosynthesis lipoprotein
MENSSYSLDKTQFGQVGRFQAMASPCEVLIDSDDQALAHAIVKAVHDEAKRIEQKFSRYLKGNVMYTLNNSAGKMLTLDEESALLMDFAFQCYELSDGLFDVTSGILRAVWKFDGSENIPSQQQITELLPLIGLDKVTWNNPEFSLREDMEMDFGGIGKEYAVDRCLQKVTQVMQNKRIPVLLNFGGDLMCNGPRFNGKAWQVGIESVGGGGSAVVSLNQGALATSGDARRFLLKDGVRYSHILNPQTGQSITQAPRSVTVAAMTCVEAGLLSTLAMLQGAEARAFLQEQEVSHWIQD